MPYNDCKHAGVISVISQSSVALTAADPEAENVTLGM